MKPFWSRLPPGFHHRRIEERGLGFHCFVWRGRQPGPTLLMNGCTHGDEYEGPIFLHELVRTWRPRQLRGTVVVVPVLYEASYLAGRYVSPLDGKNLARVFPGRRNGSPTERLAHLFREQLIRHSDYYVDFHSAGAAYEILPWVGYLTREREDEVLRRQRVMAQCFDRYWCWGAPYLAGRTISAAYELDIPAIYLEGKGKGDVAASDLAAMRRGCARLFVALGLLPGRVQLRPQRVTREGAVAEEAYLDFQHASPCDGALMAIVKAGARLRKGQQVGIVQPLDGSPARVVRAERTGRVIFARRHRFLRKGDGLVTILPWP
ncbi:MAG: succinylglutamate desuccinylase/aspartoacylase family protein [Opitutaceae bacterium]|nr:succinylglutamate desuccinylase/aspartoacylase family protein [Opitutaceae bacterium]